MGNREGKSMKTETQITEENINWFKSEDNKEGRMQIKNITKEHKASCQRFLEFLDSLNLEIYLHETNTKKEDYRKKITDLKQAIKLYKDAGMFV